MSSLAHIADKTTRISIIGLGNIGRAASNNLINKGFNVNKVYDKYCTSLYDESRFQSNIQETARDCDILITCLGTPADIKNCVETENIFENMPENSIWIDHTTTDYEQTLDFAARAKEKYNISTLECPLTGGITLLKKGKLYAHII